MKTIYIVGTVALLLVAAAAYKLLPHSSTAPLVEVGTDSPLKEAMTTEFWVGEPADESNDFISNAPSYWDEQWLDHAPHENAFYVALPYAEFDTNGTLKASAALVPWYSATKNPLLKNHWVEVSHEGKVCYGQWEDVGPNGEDDFAYVFGSAAYPVNTFGVHAGLDVSPTLWDCLGMTDNATTSWKFVDETAVPAGPWKETITSSGMTW